MRKVNMMMNFKVVMKTESNVMKGIKLIVMKAMMGIKAKVKMEIEFKVMKRI